MHKKSSSTHIYFFVIEYIMHCIVSYFDWSLTVRLTASVAIYVVIRTDSVIDWLRQWKTYRNYISKERTMNTDYYQCLWFVHNRQVFTSQAHAAVWAKSKYDLSSGNRSHEYSVYIKILQLRILNVCMQSWPLVVCYSIRKGCTHVNQG